MTIGELARRAGVRTSAVRYYESVGLLGAAPRSGGRRVYDGSALFRLAFISSAKGVGFALREIRELIGGFPKSRWEPLARRKLAELDAMGRRVAAMRALLEEHLRCRCVDVEACGRTLIALEPAAGRVGRGDP